jgi:hypothetical protein
MEHRRTFLAEPRQLRLVLMEYPHGYLRITQYFVQIQVNTGNNYPMPVQPQLHLYQRT